MLCSGTNPRRRVCRCCCGRGAPARSLLHPKTTMLPNKTSPAKKYILRWRRRRAWTARSAGTSPFRGPELPCKYMGRRNAVKNLSRYSICCLAMHFVVMILWRKKGVNILSEFVMIDRPQQAGCGADCLRKAAGSIRRPRNAWRPSACVRAKGTSVPRGRWDPLQQAGGDAFAPGCKDLVRTCPMMPVTGMASRARIHTGLCTFGKELLRTPSDGCTAHLQCTVRDVWRLGCAAWQLPAVRPPARSSIWTIVESRQYTVAAIDHALHSGAMVVICDAGKSPDVLLAIVPKRRLHMSSVLWKNDLCRIYLRQYNNMKEYARQAILGAQADLRMSWEEPVVWEGDRLGFLSQQACRMPLFQDDRPCRRIR